MKIRTGFVSNSSTTSFCIYGMQLNTEQAINYITLNPGCNKEFEKFLKENDYLGQDQQSVPYDVDDVQLIQEYGVSAYTVRDFLQQTIKEFNNSSIFDNFRLSIYANEYYIYIGYDIGYIEDGETYKQFKERVETKLNTLLPFVAVEQLSLITESIPD